MKGKTTKMNMKDEHFEKYEALSELIGIKALKAKIPATQEQIKRYLDAGDEHLNKISLRKWDIAAGAVGDAITGNFHLLWNEPFTREKARSLSLAERVCVLKHVARHHFIK